MKKILVVALSLFLLTACESKDSYMSDFVNFIERIQEKSDSFTERDWEKADDQFSKYTGSSYEKYAEELSNEEKLQIAKYQTIYATQKAKAGIKSLGDGLKDAAKKAKKAFDAE